jgi:CheY-like chemotaxis protein
MKISDLHRTTMLLVVEDSDEDFEALNRVLAQTSNQSLIIQRCIDGDDALDFLHRRGSYAELSDAACPELIILDLNLPGTDGREVLNEIKQSERLKTIPVIVLSTSANPRDVQTCYQTGVNSYILKPLRIQELQQSIQSMLDFWLKTAVLPSCVRPA